MKALYEPQSRRRIWELDFLRGIAVLLMIVDHIFYDLTTLPVLFRDFGRAGPFFKQLHSWGVAFYGSGLRWAGHYAFAGLFFLLTGVSCSFSRSNLRRGSELLLAALCLTLVSLAGSEITGIEMTILFGVLHCMALSILLYALVKNSCGQLCLLVLGSAMILAGILIKWYDAPYVSEVTSENIFEVVLGLKRYGADYFGLLPCGGLVLAGGFIGNLFYGGRKSLLPRLDGRWNRPVCAVGRHTLSVYLVHQIVIYGIILAAGLACGLSLSF